MSLDTEPPKGCDSVVCRPDTVIDSYPVHDTTYVWCIRVKKAYRDDPAIFECDNGYRGPMF